MAPMKISSALVVLGLVSPAAWLPADSIVFAPEAKSRAKKSFAESTSWKLMSLEQRVQGSLQPMAAIDAHGTVKRELVVVDTYSKLDGGVPLMLQREFETIGARAECSLEVQGEQEEFDLELTSPLSGAKVLFQREDKDAEPEAKFADERSAGANLLESLREDLDLRALLGPSDVEQGDSWKVDVADLTDLLVPGGTLALTPTSVPTSRTLEDADVLLTTLCSLADCAASELDGQVTCTWRETTTEGQANLAVIDLDWDSQADALLGPELLRRLEAVGKATPREDLSLSVNWSSKGGGELVWDLAKKRAHSLTLKLDSKVSWVENWSQQGMTIALAVGMEAQSELAVEFEAD